MSTVNVSVLVVEDDAPLREALIDTLRAAGKWKDAPDYGKAKTGRITLQDHGSIFWFRNVKIRPIVG